MTAQTEPASAWGQAVHGAAHRAAPVAKGD